jgi:hypothetical protein
VTGVSSTDAARSIACTTGVTVAQVANPAARLPLPRPDTDHKVFLAHTEFATRRRRG